MAAKKPKAAEVSVGILGKGTVGGAFKELLTDRAEMVAEVSGRRGDLVGALVDQATERVADGAPAQEANSRRLTHRER